MTRTLQWTIGLSLVEEDGTTTCEAVLNTGTRTLTGHGTARCNPQDVDVPQIGDELAASRALSDLARRLMRVADRDMEAVGAGATQDTSGSFGWPGPTT